MIDQIQEFYPTQIWSKAKSQIENELSAEMFASWFKNLECIGGTEDCIELLAENDFAAMWLKDNYADLLFKNLSIVCGRNIKVNITSKPDDQEAIVQSPIERTQPVARQRAIVETKQVRINTPISPRNTFENFIVGESNEFAYSAALAVAQNLGVAFNPLFIYGATGLGKTHLMHAIAHFVLKNNPEKNIVYLSSESFVNDYIAAMKAGNIASFRQKCRQADVLLIDDVQFFAKKEASQNEFFHTFNELFHSGKQIVLSCDRPINEVADIEQRLVTRFSWGVSVDIQAPDYETRLAILQKKIEASKSEVSISPEAVDFVARRFTKNVRRMEGALTNLIGYATLISKDSVISLEKAQQLLSNVLLEEEECQLIDVEKIQRKTAEYFRIDVEQLCGKARPVNIAQPRQIAMYISRKLTTLSLEEIGKRFGGRNHATVMHAMRVVDQMMSQDEDIKRAVEYLLKMLSI
ncbi:MAG: chromosomal replication initiator protein DnaA [Verrucomicrobiaceae bacterium]|nr:chromosomal replication initiator protein DnaA [Verrucomicrobiaceae bacterium]